MSRILVVYGTTHGHTAHVAASIAGDLRAMRLDVDVIEAGKGNDPSPSAYDGIIVAASVYRGHYQPSVRQWLHAHVREFGDRPTAFVSMCLGVLQQDEKTRAEVQAIMQRLLDDVAWSPAMVRTFPGALLYTQYNFVLRWVMKRIVSKAGGDTDTSRDYVYTRWEDVRAFAAEFGRRVAAAA